MNKVAVHHVRRKHVERYYQFWRSNWRVRREQCGYHAQELGRRGIYNSGYDVHVTQAGSLAKLLPKGFDLITDANSSPSKPGLKKNKRRHTVRKQSQKNKGEGGSIQIKEWAYKASFKWAKLNCSVECATSSMSGSGYRTSLLSLSFSCQYLAYLHASNKLVKHNFKEHDLSWEMRRKTYSFRSNRLGLVENPGRGPVFRSDLWDR